jgi:fructose-1,6-bisphosphatase II
MIPYHLFLQATEKAAIAAKKHVGCYNEKQADQAAVDAMRIVLDQLPVSSRVVIGEGTRDQAPMLFQNEILGNGDEKFDIAVDPLECTTACAQGKNGAMSTLLVGKENTIFSAPDLYMSKLVVAQREYGEDIHLNNDIKTNIHTLSTLLNKPVDQLKISVLLRDRHRKLISDLVDMNVKLYLIDDGDVAAAINVCLGKLDMYIGIGGAPEGVIAAGAIKLLNGYMDCEIKDIGLYSNCYELIKDDPVFISTAVTDNTFIESGNDVQTNSIIITKYNIIKISNQIINI